VRGLNRQDSLTAILAFGNLDLQGLVTSQLLEMTTTSSSQNLNCVSLEDFDHFVTLDEQKQASAFIGLTISTLDEQKHMSLLTRKPTEYEISIDSCADHRLLH